MADPTNLIPVVDDPDHAIFRSLRYRNFRLFFFGQLISQTGTWLTMVTQTLLVLNLTDNSGVALGWLTAFQFGPMLLLGAWAGAVTDRVDKRRLLIVVQSLAMAQSAILGIIVLSGSATVAIIYAMAALKGILTAFDNPTRRSFVVEMVEPGDVPNAVSLNSAIMTGSRVVGPAAAGALVLAFGFGWPFIIDALSYIAVIASLVMMRTQDLRRSVPTPRGKGQVRQGLRYIASEPHLLVPLIMTGVIGTFAFNFSVTVPLLVNGPLGGGTQAFTMLFAVLSLGALVGALLTARRVEVTPNHLVRSSAAFGLTMVMLAASPTLTIAFPAAIALGLASMVFMTSSTAIVQLLAGAEYRGRVLAIQSLVFLGSTPIGGPLIGWISDSAGPRVAILAGAVSCLVASAYGARALGGDHADQPVSVAVAD